MKEDVAKITKPLKPLAKRVWSYRISIFIIAFLGAYIFLLTQVGNFINSEPSQEVVKEKLGNVQRLEIDQDSVDRILELEQQDVDVRTLFRQARESPFKE